MPPLSMLIKPASSLCNINCRYCFYHDLAENRLVSSHGIMSDEVLEALITKALQFADKQCTFAFQGGEPTVAGLSFYKRVIVLQQKHNLKKVQINNAIQTNGMVIDVEWAKFLSENHFLVGVSLDGPRDIHNANRIDAKGKGTFDRVMTAIRIMKKEKVEFNILAVTTGWSARHAEKMYRFFKKEGFQYLQFIPCLDPLQEEPFQHAHSLTPERYSQFLITIFDLWYDDMMNGSPISIRWFDNLAGMMIGMPPEACGMFGECTCQFVVESDGSVYPCDFYVLDEWKIGNIVHDGFVEMRESDNAQKFIQSSRHVDNECIQCEWKNLCRGGCRRSREPYQNELPTLNLYCESYKTFFTHAVPGLQDIARKYSQNRH